MHSSRSAASLRPETEPARPLQALILMLAFTAIFFSVAAMPAYGQFGSDEEGRTRYKLDRNKDVVFDKGKVLSGRTTYEIDMKVRDGKLVDVMLMTKENYDRYKAGLDFQVANEGSDLSVSEFKAKFKIPYKDHWVWVVDNTARPPDGANSGEDLTIYAKVDISTINVLAYFALLAFIVLLIVLFLSSIYNRLGGRADSRSTAEDHAQEEEGAPPVELPTLREHRSHELPGFEDSSSSYDEEYESSASEEGLADLPASTPAAAATSRRRTTTSTQRRQTRRVTHTSSPVTAVPANINPNQKRVPGYIRRREARGEGLGAVGTAAPEVGRQRVTTSRRTAPGGQEFTHCPNCFAIVPGSAPFCYRCKASMAA